MSPPNGQKPIRLADLDTPVGDVELPSGRTIAGRTIAVRAIDGAGAQLYTRLQAGELTDGREPWDLARRCLPSATEEEIQALTPQMCSGVAMIAMGHVNAVMAYLEALEKNAVSPVLETTPGPAPGDSSPPTPSATSAFGWPVHLDASFSPSSSPPST